MQNRYSFLLQNDNKPVAKPTDSANVHKPTSGQADKPTSGHVVKTANLQVDKTTKPLVEKYTTHLPTDVIKRIKLRAVEEERSDYEIVLEAVETYLKAKK